MAKEEDERFAVKERKTREMEEGKGREGIREGSGR